MSLYRDFGSSCYFYIAVILIILDDNDTSVTVSSLYHDFRSYSIKDNGAVGAVQLFYVTDS